MLTAFVMVGVSFGLGLLVGWNCIAQPAVVKDFLTKYLGN